MTQRRITIFFLALGDLALLYGALFAALFLRYAPSQDFDFMIRLHLLPFLFVFILWLFVFGSLGLYDIRFMKNGKVFFYRLIRAIFTNIVLTIPIFYLLPSLELEPRRNLLLIAIISTIFIFIWRYLFNLLIIKTPAYRVLFFGISPEAIELVENLLKYPHFGQKPVAFLSMNDAPIMRPLPIPYFAREHDLPRIIRDYSIDTIVIFSEVKENKTLVSMLFKALPMGVGIIEFTAFHEMITGKIPASIIAEVWFLENLIGIKKRFYDFSKRALDLVGAALAMIPFFLLYPFIALAIKLDSRGPVLFRQNRVGKNGALFSLIKFRSMVEGAEAMAGIKGEGKDMRHTRVGRFLRKSYLDELPQIFNVVKGEMSFVGPRPERPEYVDELKKRIPFYEMRLLVPPGITGWAQINMENDASVEDAPEKMQYDLYYIKNRSLILDLLILLRTVFAVLRRQGR